MVVGVVVLAAALGAFAVWFQWEQTRRCLRFFGPEVATAIQSSPVVEIWGIESDGTRFWTTSRQDVSQASGLAHLRRGLIEDFNYEWGDGDSVMAESTTLPAEDWDVAFAFFAAGSQDRSPVILVVDLDAPGSLTVVGRPGRVTLGRLGPGLAKWVAATQSATISSEKSAY